MSPEQERQERKLFDLAGIRDIFGHKPSHRETELMWDAWRVRAALASVPGDLDPIYAAPPAPDPSGDPLVPAREAWERLHTFLNAAAGDGHVFDGVDAADLCIALFPDRYAATLRAIDGQPEPRP